MRATLIIGAFALFSLAAPANAQMCGTGQQVPAATPAQGGMMCGAAQHVADDPMANKPAQPQAASGMCPCCKNMAMMGSGKGSMQHMPGMEMK